jgi:signal transduction histidine kinase
VSSAVDADLLRSAFDTLPFEAVVVDATGRIVLANEPWRAFGEANGAAHDGYWVGENYLSVCRRADDPAAADAADGLEALLAGDRDCVRLEYPCHSPDEQRWFILEATPLVHEGTRYAVVAHVDVTARRRAELQRDARIEQLETIVDILSHDLRNPLAIIQGYSSRLTPRSSDPEAVAAIRESADRMAELIDVTLSFARTRSIDDPTRVALADVATAAWAGTPTDDASLEIEASRRFVADEPLLRQALENLFRNCVEHGGSSVTVRVGTTADGFYVEDDGPGIPAAKRRRLQERDVSHDSRTGLGLAIVRAIVIAHDWTLSITDGREGGTRVEVSGIDSVDE